MTSGSLETNTLSTPTTVDNLVSVALKSSIESDLQHDPVTPKDFAIIREGAIERLILFEEHVHAGILRLMRDMEIERSYEQLGHESLQEWVHSLPLNENQTDTLLRLARAVERIFVLADQARVVSSDGEIITSDLLIEKASPSALMKLSYSFAEADPDQRKRILEELLTGTSNARQIKRLAGVMSDIMLEALVEIADDDTKVYRFTLTPAHEAFLHERLRGSLVVRFTEED
jgi:hypothetical protein